MIYYYGIIFFLSLGISLLITTIIIKLSHRYRVFDIPTNHKIHKTPIPTFGGLSIYFSLVMAVIYILKENIIQYNERSLIVNLLIGATIIVLLGIYDDLKGASPWLKLSIQIFVALFAYFLGFRVDIVTNPLGGEFSLGLLALPVTILWIIGIINAINLIDGLDGLASGIVCIASFFMLLPEVRESRILIATVLISLVGSTLGFLRFNFPPAKIFLGDTGSMVIGYLLACLSLIGTRKGTTAVALLVPIVILGVPILDIFLSVKRRLINGSHLFMADQKHLHHRLLNIGLPPKKVILLLYGISIVFGVVSFILTIVSKQLVIIILMALLIFCIIGLKILEVKELRLGDHEK